MRSSPSSASWPPRASGPSEVDENVAEVDESGGEVDESSAEEDARRSAALRARYLDYLCEEVAAGLSLDGMSVAILQDVLGPQAAMRPASQAVRRLYQRKLGKKRFSQCL